MKKLVILKIGGSVITYKEEALMKVRRTQIKRMAQEIKKAQNEENFTLLLIHGAGSFGHPRAQKYKLWQGLFKRRQFLEFCHTHLDCLRLNEIICEVFLKENLPVFPVQPSVAIVQKDGVIKKFNTAAIKMLLTENFIPVLYGDVVLDTKINGSVCSGDTITVYLAKILGAKKVFFATNVEGVFDQDPNLRSQVILMKSISEKNFSSILRGVGKSKAKTDAGGGMRGKILEIKRQIPHIPVRIFDGTKPSNVYNALKGRNLGTFIQFRNGL